MFALLVGSYQVIKRPYTYERRAQATSHQWVWKQMLLCDDKQPLLEWARTHPPRSGQRYRIEGLGHHARCGCEDIAPQTANAARTVVHFRLNGEDRQATFHCQTEPDDEDTWRTRLAWLLPAAEFVRAERIPDRD